MTDMDHQCCRDWLRSMGWGSCWEVRTHRPQDAADGVEIGREHLMQGNVSKDPKVRSDHADLQVQGIDSFSPKLRVHTTGLDTSPRSLNGNACLRGQKLKGILRIQQNMPIKL